MKKSNFLLVDLNESKTKKLAETITSDTSRKILNHLAEKEDSEAKIAEILQLPISTVHYHLQKLQEAGLVKVEEFHYSQKGREVNHYKLANKYIIIAPSKVSGLREKLKGILPVAIITLGISVIIKLTQTFTFRAAAMKSAEVMESSAQKTATLAQDVTATTLRSTPDIAVWFAVGSVVTMGIYVVVMIVKEYWSKHTSK